MVEPLYCCKITQGKVVHSLFSLTLVAHIVNILLLYIFFEVPTNITFDTQDTDVRQMQPGNLVMQNILNRMLREIRFSLHF